MMKHLYSFLIIMAQCCAIVSFSQPTHILVFTKTNGFRHKAIGAGKVALTALAQEQHWEVTFTEDSLEFSNYNQLKKYHAVVFMYTTGKVFGTPEETAFQQYIENGGGFVSIHTGTDCEKNWDWYMNMVGAKFKQHPKQAVAKFVTQNHQHPATKNLPKEWQYKEEIYNFTKAVAATANVLVSVDESSYTGGTMNGNHPLVWYQYYEGGRVFQCAMGHNEDFYQDKKMLGMLAGGINWAIKKEEVAISNAFEPLIDDSLTHFDKYIGVPDTSMHFNLPKDSTGKYSVALGLNHDTLQVYTTRKEDKNTLLHVSGELFGGLMTKEEYGDFHLKAQFRWGTKKYAPRLTLPRDNGILYHCVGPNGAFWKVWKQSIECQVQENDCGDLFTLAGTTALVHSSKVVNQQKPTQFTYTYSPKDSLHTIKGRCCRSKSYEKPNGQWNTIEVIAKGDTSIHIVNGHINMVVIHATQKRGNEELPLTSGKIIIQSEGAEIDYKDMVIKHIDAIPRKLLKKAGLN